MNPAKKKERQGRMTNRHWIVVEVFKLAEQAKLLSPGCEPFTKKIFEVSGKHIPSGSLKYWQNGHSTPKVDELEAMAKAVGYELDMLELKPNQ